MTPHVRMTSPQNKRSCLTDCRENDGSQKRLGQGTAFFSSGLGWLPIAMARRHSLHHTVFKRLKLCSAPSHLPFSARFACSCCLAPLRHNKRMVNNGQLPIRRIGNGLIIIPTCITRTISTHLNIIRADRICIIGTLRKCRFLPIINRGSIFIRKSDVTIPGIISGLTFSNEIWA